MVKKKEHLLEMFLIVWFRSDQFEHGGVVFLERRKVSFNCLNQHGVLGGRCGGVFIKQ